MSIAHISNGESGASTRTKLNGLIDEVNGQAVIPGSVISWLTACSYKTLSGDTVFLFTGNTDGVTIRVALTNTTSNRIVSWPVGVKWSGGVEPTQTIGAKTDLYTFTQINGVIYGSVEQNY